MATLHPVFALCLDCGRILCEAEAWAWCCACGASLDGAPPPPAAHALAVAAKDRLLHYDRTSAARTRVLDDDAEHFAAPSADAEYDAFLSPEDAAAAAAAAKADREARAARSRGMRIALEFGGSGGELRVTEEGREAREGAREAGLAAMRASASVARADAFHVGLAAEAAAVVARGVGAAGSVGGRGEGGGQQRRGWRPAASATWHARARHGHGRVCKPAPAGAVRGSVL